MEKKALFDFKSDKCTSCCYRLEHLHFENPTFKKIQVSFLITMENSQRRDLYMRELKLFRPTAHVIIVHNKGYKKCFKKDVSKPYHDLWHANLEIFKMVSAWKHPILILEDDVNFTAHFPDYAGEIENFVEQEEVQVYNLGCVPILCSPIFNKNHARVFLFGGTHAVIYSYEARKKLIKKNSISFNTKLLHDEYVSTHCGSFTHKYPCAVQTIPFTENQETSWPLYSKVYLKMYAFTEPEIDGYVFYYFQHSALYFGGVVPLFILILCSICLVCRKQWLRQRIKSD